MRFAVLLLLAFAVFSFADEPTGDRLRFAAPKRIKAGDALLGENRLYPSPVLYDIDGDKRPEILVGDLFGGVTFAKRAAGDPPRAFGKEEKLLDKDGKPLRFHNW